MFRALVFRGSSVTSLSGSVAQIPWGVICESSVVAGRHERTHTPRLRDCELAGP